MEVFERVLEIAGALGFSLASIEIGRYLDAERLFAVRVSYFVGDRRRERWASYGDTIGSAAEGMMKQAEKDLARQYQILADTISPAGGR